NDVLGDSIPAVFYDKKGNKMNSIPEGVQKQWNNEYGVKVGYNPKTEMLYYDGEVETNLVVSKSAKEVFVNALTDTKTGKSTYKEYGKINFGYDLGYPNGAPGKLTLGGASKSINLFVKGVPLKSREAYIDLADFDFNNSGKSLYHKYQNVGIREYNFARVFEHEWMGHVLTGKFGEGMFLNSSRKTGPAVQVVNKYRVEMGLLLRLNYGLPNDGTMIFGNSEEDLKASLKSLRKGNTEGLKMLVPTWYMSK
ncbi:MAG: hypothetical protein CVU05_15280, partial [Bacteroidetes bacterium HGW-Bacteroidetes-21]